MARLDEHAYLLRCDDAKWQELSAYADRQGVSVNSVLNVCIHLGLRRYREVMTSEIEAAKARPRVTSRGRR